MGAAVAFGLCETIGLVAATFPQVWLSLFDTDPAMLAAGTHYLQTVGPFFGLFGMGNALYFASQGAARLLWPLLANFARLVIATAGGWLVLRLGGTLTEVFFTQGLALATYGLINAAAIASGSWFRLSNARAVNAA